MDIISYYIAIFNAKEKILLSKISIVSQSLLGGVITPQRKVVL